MVIYSPKKRILLIVVLGLIVVILSNFVLEQYLYEETLSYEKTLRRNCCLETSINKYCQSDPCVLIDFKITSQYKEYAIGDSFNYNIKIKNIGNITINDTFKFFLEPGISFAPFTEGKELVVVLKPGELTEYPAKEEKLEFSQIYTFREIGTHKFDIKASEQYIHFLDWEDPCFTNHGIFGKTFDVISSSERSFLQRSENIQNYTILLSTVAIILSVFSIVLAAFSIFQSKRLQQASFFGQMSSAELQHRTKINEVLEKYEKKKKLSKSQKEKMRTWLLLHLNVYETLAFSVNNKFIEEKDAYKMWHKIIREIYENLLPIVKEGDFEELIKLINKWKIKYKW